MKALLRKEFREILWLGALGLVVCGLLLLYPYLTFKEFMHGLALGQTDVRGHLVQPLVERLYLV